MLSVLEYGTGVKYPIIVVEHSGFIKLVEVTCTEKEYRERLRREKSPPKTVIL